MNPTVTTLPAAATHVNRHPVTLRRAIATGKLPATKSGPVWLINLAEAEAWAGKRKRNEK